MENKRNYFVIVGLFIMLSVFTVFFFIRSNNTTNYLDYKVDQHVSTLVSEIKYTKSLLEYINATDEPDEKSREILVSSINDIWEAYRELQILSETTKKVDDTSIDALNHLKNKLEIKKGLTQDNYRKHIEVLLKYFNLVDEKINAELERFSELEYKLVLNNNKIVSYDNNIQMNNPFDPKFKFHDDNWLEFISEFSEINETYKAS